MVVETVKRISTNVPDRLNTGVERITLTFLEGEILAACMLNQGLLLIACFTFPASDNRDSNTHGGTH